MAIPQSRYVKIDSTVLPSVATPNMTGLVLTDSGMSGAKADLSVKAKYDAGDVLEMTYDSIIIQFGDDSEEAQFATLYFSYNGPNGSPGSILVAKKLTGEASYVATFNRVSGANFRTWTVLSCADLTPAQIKALADANNAVDEKPYRFCFATSNHALYGGGSGSGVVDMTGYPNVTAIEIGTEESSGTEEDPYYGQYDMALTMAACAATDYTGENTTITQMFRQLGGAYAHVYDNSLAEALDQAKFNYFGVTKSNGDTITFYQRGVDLDGNDTAVMDNDAWLRGTIAGNIMTLFIGANKIPANYVGANAVRSVISDAAIQGVANGAILKLKELTSAMKTQILLLTNGDEDAVNLVYEDGYFISVWITTNPDGSYVLKYRLIYSKGDAIKKVEGQHNLV